MTKLRVLQLICPSGFYGAERWILALAKHLDPQQFDCDLAVTREPGSGDLEVVKRFRELDLHATELNMKHRFDFAVISRLVGLIKARNIDIIHTHGYKSDILGVIAARKAGIKSVCTPHGFENADDLKLRLYIWLGCQSMRFFDHVAPLSRQLCEDVKQYGVKAERLSYIQNGVDLSEVEAVRNDASASAVTERKRIGFIGQMISRKNIDDILGIFDALHAEHPDTELVLLGDGEERERLETLSKTLSSAAAISFLGFRDDRLELLKSFDLFVMTSSLEGIPRCLMETMAMGVPVAAYQIPGVDQLIEHNKTGLLAAFGDKTTLLSYWKDILYNEQTAQKLTMAAQAFVEAEFSAKRMAAEYQSLFEQLTRSEYTAKMDSGKAP